MHSPDWQPSSQLERRGILVDKAVECKSVDLDETEQYLNVFKPQHQRYEPSYGTYDPLDDFSRIDDDHVYHELEVSANNMFQLFSLCWTLPTATATPPYAGLAVLRMREE